MNKKGSALIVVIIVFGFLILIIGLIIFIVILNQSNKNNSPSNPENISLYLQANDIQAKASISSDYLILPENLMGSLVPNAYTSVGNVSNNGILILCSENGYYSSLIKKTFDNAEIYNNASKLDCYLNQIGTISIHNSGNLQENGNSQITLNVRSQGLYQNMQTCLAYTSGIKSAAFLNSSIKRIDIPSRFLNKVDACYDLNTTLDNSENNFNMDVETSVLSPLDTLTFYFFDEDLYLNSTGNFTLGSENNGNNLGSNNDVPYIINNPNV